MGRKEKRGGRKGEKIMDSSESDIEKPVYNPHDEAFKLAFRKKSLARIFFRKKLPEKIRKHVDFNKLEIVNKSYVDEKLREKHSDIVYKTRIKDAIGFLYILFEHQSKPDPWMAYRLLCYIENIWKEYRDQHPNAKRFPMVFSIVLYHGKATWNSPMRLKELVEGHDEFSEFIPDFTYQLYDLGEYDDEMFTLGEEMALGVVLYLFKHIFDDNLAGMFRKLMDLLAAIIDQPTFLEFLEWALRYTYHARNESEEDIRRVIDQETERLTDERLRRLAMTQAMTTAEQMRQKYGIEALSSMLTKMLKKRFGNISTAVEQKLGQSDSDILDKFGEAIFDFKELRDAERWFETH